MSLNEYIFTCETLVVNKNIVFCQPIYRLFCGWGTTRHRIATSA